MWEVEEPNLFGDNGDGNIMKEFSLYMVIVHAKQFGLHNTMQIYIIEPYKKLVGLSLTLGTTSSFNHLLGLETILMLLIRICCFRPPFEDPNQMLIER